MAITPLRLLVPMILGCLIMPSAFAESGRADYDLDDDGLIEINSLADLDEVRNNLDGTSLYGDSTGCPVDGCIGFELTTTLDFDTNADGVMDTNDAYWNGGDGWMPIGSSSVPFTSTFDGNGHQIRNLYINRSNTDYIGLFGAISGESAQLRNIGLTGELMSVVGRSKVGGFVGYAKGAERIEQSYVTGAVSGDDRVGGLVGSLLSSVMSNSFASGAVTGDYYVGGLVGYLSSSTINSSFATGAVSGNSSIGGLTGSSSSSVITYSYWAVDTTGISSTSALAATLAELQCPAGADNTSCVADQTLYAEWDSNVWDFGTSSQLPGLIFNGTIYRDSDTDGSLDGEDVFPNNHAASSDGDGDSYPDRWNSRCGSDCIESSGLTLDQFPTIAAAWQDEDLDAYPDSWIDGCDASCQAASGLTLDSYLNDTDNDGINNSNDMDDNNDGITDADADSDGLIDISSLEQLNAIRYNLTGIGRTLSEGGATDSSGCPVAVVNGIHQFQCMGYELINNLDFDSNADGVMDANDAYWNEGDGWEPIGSEDYFESIFDGNGYEIRNLYINRSTPIVGLFAVISGDAAALRNIGVIGKLVATADDYVGVLAGAAISGAKVSDAYAIGTVSGNKYAGGLVGFLIDASISRSFVIGNVSGDAGVGGLVGAADVFASITDTFATGSVAGSSYIGGLVGAAGIEYEGGVVIANSFSSGRVTATDSYGGGLVGYEDPDTIITDSHWATDTTDQSDSALKSEFDNYFGATLAELQCPTSSDNKDDCVISNTLYAGWDSSVWDFGTSTQLPGLIINGIVYRDEDGNGSLDENQAPTVTLTLKQDGYVVSDITAGDGDVTLEATITDPDASDRHTLSWTYEGITVTSETDTGVTFKSDNLVAGEYTVSVVATDNRYSPLSAEAEITFTVYSAYVPEPEPAPGNTSASSGKKGGGGALGLIWLMLCGGLVYTGQRRVVFAG
ncbi:MAG: hypothetical protein VB958_07930 [Thalassolituus sp.]|uniref:hypothetical protein n=1 Tax=Thalassolituus sp. TaxID=2030822 RepID=UPI003981FE02